MQSTFVYSCSRDGGTSSSTVMAAVVIAILRVPCQRKNILTSRAVFVNHLPRIGVLNGNSDRVRPFTPTLFKITILYASVDSNMSLLSIPCMRVRLNVTFYIINLSISSVQALSHRNVL